MSKLLEKFEMNNISLNVYGTYEEPLFKGIEIGKLLGFSCIKKTIYNMPQEFKKKLTVTQGVTVTPPNICTFLTEGGLYYLAMRSNLPKAKQFQVWICQEVLPTIRKKGYYELQPKEIKHTLTYKMETEYDLHTKVVDFIRSKYPNCLFTASLGEMQDTSDKRIKAYKMGYTKGECDLIINNLHKLYSGFVLEFKSPSGIGAINKYQSNRLKQYRENKFKTLLSNDYDQIIIDIIDYMANVRIKCDLCNNKFRNIDTLANHKKYFHRVITN